MVRKTKGADIKPADLNDKQKEIAIKKIERMIDKLSKFDQNTVSDRSDSRITTIADELDKLIMDIFGYNTVEYQRYRHIKSLDIAPISLHHEIAIERVQDGLRVSIKQAIDTLLSIKSGFMDDLQDAESDKPTRILKAYGGLDIHPKISKVSDELYKDGHYAQAVEAAVKELIFLVKEKSNIGDKDGTSLMQYVFSPNNPILKLNSLKSQSEKDEQQGYMELFTGAVRAIRNPRAHENIIDDPEEALEYIGFISHLAKRLDETTQ